MTLTVTGEEITTSAGSVAQLVEELDAGDGCAVAVDGEVIPRSRWETTELSPGATIDILTAVQGG